MSFDQTFNKLNRKPYPVSMSVDIHTYCNGRCFFCPYHRLSQQGKVPWGKMKWPLFEKIVTEYAGLIEEYNFKGDMGFCLMGEPFIEKEIIKYTKLVIDKGIEHIFTTNGVLMNKDLVNRLIDIGYNGKFRISCHGIRPQTIKKLMGVDVKRILKNVDYLLERYPSKKISIIAFPFGWEKGEKQELKAYWKKRSVCCAGGVPSSRGGLIGEIARKPLRKLSGCVDNRPLRQMVVSYNGDVLLCCFDMERREIIGNLENNSLKNIWNSSRYSQYIDQLYFNKTSPDEFICKHCEWACTPFNSNKMLKLPRKVYRHFKKKSFERIDLNHLMP